MVAMIVSIEQGSRRFLWQKLYDRYGSVATISKNWFSSRLKQHGVLALLAIIELHSRRRSYSFNRTFKSSDPRNGASSFGVKCVVTSTLH